jgi:hypothetical protein
MGKIMSKAAIQGIFLSVIFVLTLLLNACGGDGSINPQMPEITAQIPSSQSPPTQTSSPVSGPAAPFASIVTPPQSLSVSEYQPATFDVKVVSNEPLEYEWMRNGVSIRPPYMFSAFTVHSVSKEDNGAQFSVAVTDSKGNRVTSQAATLTVIPYIPNKKAEIIRLAFGAIYLGHIGRGVFYPVHDDKFYMFNEQCSDGGFVKIRLNGMSLPAAGGTVPLGENLLETTFNECTTYSYYNKAFYDGFSSLIYSKNPGRWNASVKATFSNLRYGVDPIYSDPWGTTQSLRLNGPMNLEMIRSEGAFNTDQMTATPLLNTTLTSLRSHLTATFVSGATSIYSYSIDPNIPVTTSNETRWRFDQLTFIVDGNTYVIDGVLSTKYTNDPIKVTENGTEIGRVFTGAQNFFGATLQIGIDNMIVPYDKVN